MTRCLELAGGKLTVALDAQYEPVELEFSADISRRLGEGTKFQRSMNALAMMEEVFAELFSGELAAAGFTPSRHGATIKAAVKHAIPKEVLNELDPEAVRLFFED